MSGFESVGQILPKAVTGRKIAGELLALQARKSFLESLNSLFRNKKLPRIRAGKFSSGSLTILVPDPAWSFELRQKEAEILKKLNLALGGKVVARLRFKVQT